MNKNTGPLSEGFSSQRSASLVEALRCSIDTTPHKVPSIAEALLLREDGSCVSAGELVVDEDGLEALSLLCDALLTLLECVAAHAADVLAVVDGAGLTMTREELASLLEEGVSRLKPLVRLAILIARALGDEASSVSLQRLSSLEHTLEDFPNRVPDVAAIFEVSELGGELEHLLRTRLPQRGKAPDLRWPSDGGPFVCLGSGGGEALVRVLSGEHDGRSSERRARFARDFSVRLQAAREQASEMLASGEASELPEGDLLGTEEAETLGQAGVWAFVAWERASRDIPRYVLALDRLWGVVRSVRSTASLLVSSLTELCAGEEGADELSVSLEPILSEGSEVVVYLPPCEGDEFVAIYPLESLRAAVAELVGALADGHGDADEDFARDRWTRLVTTSYLPAVPSGKLSMTKREFSCLGLAEGSSVTVIGNDDHVEVCPTDAWEREQAGLEDELDELIQKSLE